MRNRLVTAGVYLTAAFYAFLCEGCGAPLGYGPDVWIDVGTVPPGGVRSLTGADDGLYGIPIFRGNLIGKYAGGGFGLEYAWPENVRLYDLGFRETDGWAAGESEYGAKPFLARRGPDGWAELPVQPAPGFICIEEVFPTGEDSCWLYVSDGEAGYLATYRAGVIREYAATAPLDAAAYAPASDIIYGLYLGASPGSPATLVMSSDGGTTWVKESFDFRYYGGAVSVKPVIVPAGDTLFFLAEYAFDEHGYYLIVRRTGGVGEGRYDLSYLSYLGPHLEDLKDLAFRTPDDGMGVGWKASLAYDGRDWVQENVGARLFFSVAANPTGGFWAVSEDRLLFHP